MKTETYMPGDLVITTFGREIGEIISGPTDGLYRIRKLAKYANLKMYNRPLYMERASWDFTKFTTKMIDDFRKEISDKYANLNKFQHYIKTQFSTKYDKSSKL